MAQELKTPISPRFQQSVQANLQFWLGCDVSEIPELDHGNLLICVEYGLVLPSTQLEAIKLAKRYFPQIESLGYFREWICVIEKSMSNLRTENQCLKLQIQIYLGHLYWHVGDNERASKHINRSLRIAKQIHHKTFTAEAYYGLALINWSNGQLDSAMNFCKESLKTYTQIDGEDRSLGLLNNLLGMIYFSQKRYVEAENFFNNALQCLNNIDEQRVVTKILINKTFVTQVLGKPNDALKWINKLFREYQLYLTPGEISRLETTRGLIHYQKGNQAGARSALNRALPSNWGSDLSNIFTAWARLIRGHLYLIEGEWQEARADFEACMVLNQNEISPDITITEYARVGILEIKKNTKTPKS